jgi:hypothetical protein
MVGEVETLANAGLERLNGLGQLLAVRPQLDVAFLGGYLRRDELASVDCLEQVEDKGIVDF